MKESRTECHEKGTNLKLKKISPKGYPTVKSVRKRKQRKCKDNSYILYRKSFSELRRDIFLRL